MAEREKVMQGLKTIKAFVLFNGATISSEVVLDTVCGAIELLRAQEPETSNAPKPDNDICWYDITHKYALEKVVDALKAKEPKKPILDPMGVFYCTNCGNQPVGYKNCAGEVFQHNLYCPKCGQAVKWDA